MGTKAAGGALGGIEEAGRGLVGLGSVLMAVGAREGAAERPDASFLRGERGLFVGGGDLFVEVCSVFMVVLGDNVGDVLLVGGEVEEVLPLVEAGAVVPGSVLIVFRGNVLVGGDVLVA
jgi:hypothetical protein